MKNITTRIVNLSTIPARGRGKQHTRSAYEVFIQKALALTSPQQGVKITFRKERDSKVGTRVSAIRSVIKTRHLDHKLTLVQRKNSIYIVPAAQTKAFANTAAKICRDIAPTHPAV